MKLRTLFIAIFISSFSIAETEKFNMSLNGDFYKDYCSIEITESVNYNLSVPVIRHKEKIYQEYIDSYLQETTALGTTRFSLTCSQGAYDIAISNTLSDYTVELANGINYYNNITIVATENLLTYKNEQTFHREVISSVAPFRISDATFPSDNSGLIEFMVTAGAYSENSTWDNLPDSFHISQPIIVTIDKH
tara:strand:+ start:2657 stop:3232 length:576 start_codon:yes stop_codon:yes gene_type:complete